MYRSDVSVTEIHQIFSILLVTNKYSVHLLSERLAFVCRQYNPICMWCSICAPRTAITWRMATYNVFVSQELILNNTDTNTSETFSLLELTVAGSQSGHSSAHGVFLSFNCSGFYCLRFWDAVEHYQQQILGGGKKLRKEIKTYKKRRDIKLNLKRGGWVREGTGKRRGRKGIIKVRISQKF